MSTLAPSATRSATDRASTAPTSRLNPVFSKALATLLHRVPLELLKLPQEGHTNSEGRRPSRAALLRVRTTALHDWHAGGGMGRASSGAVPTTHLAQDPAADGGGS